MLFIGHRGNTLANQLLQGFYVERCWNELLLTAHFQKGTNLHLSVLLFDIALAQHNSITVHVLVNVHLEKLFELRHVSEVDLD